MTPPFRAIPSLLIPTVLSLALILSGCNSHVQPEEAISELPLSNTVQLTPEALKAANLTTFTVQTHSVSIPLTATAIIKADANRVFHINSFVSGRILQDRVALGDTVRAGQTLAVVQNLEVAKIQANYIHELHNNEMEVAQAKTRYALAKSRMAREERLLAEGISPQKDFQDAQAEAEMAKTELAGKREHRIHLRSEAWALLSAYGVAPNSSHTEKINTGSPLIAPRGGVILKKSITLGDMITPDTVMYEVADLSHIWLDVTVFPKDIALVHPGQTLVFTTDSLPGKTFTGKIDYIQPTTQENNATYIARANLSNVGGLLKPGIFGQVLLNRNLSQQVAVVPESAIQRYGREAFVFIPEGSNRFRKQTIVLGDKVQDGYTIQQGLSAGTTVVGNGSFILKAELVKTQSAPEE